jgi:hypothetical protein
LPAELSGASLGRSTSSLRTSGPGRWRSGGLGRTSSRRTTRG